MSLGEIKKIFEERREKLINLLKNPQGLSPEKQHQIYGAILEIENFLRVLEYFRQKEIEENLKYKLKNINK